MSKLITNTIRHVDGSNDNITLDSSQNVTVNGKARIGTTSAAATNEAVTIKGDSNGDCFLSLRSSAHADGNDQRIRFMFGDAIGSSANICSSISSEITDTSSGALKANLVISANRGDAATNRYIIYGDNSVDHEFKTKTATSLLKLHNSGDVEIADGDLKVANTHGINFSATGGPSAGSGDSELFADYEEGQFNPTIGGWTTPGTPTYHGTVSRRGYYQKVGNMVTCWMYLAWEGISSAAGVLFIGGLPFTVKSTSGFSAPNANLTTVSGATMSSSITMPDLTHGGDVVLHQYGGMGASALMYQSRHEEAYNAVLATSGRNDSSSYTKEFFCSLYYPTT